MRIRRNASKILGSASLAYAANPNRPSAPAAAAGAEAEDFTVCELNCSPWDLMGTDPNSSYCDFLITNLKGEAEEGDEDEGILGNTIKTDEAEPTASAAAELTLKEMKEIEEKKLVKRRRISRGKEKDTAAVAYCKKTDGKGWHCKRQAQLPNSLCSYHLAQIKAYSSNHRALADPPSSVAGGGKCSSSSSDNHRKRKAAGEEATDKDSGFYYYYEGFGPWRGKRRGRPVSAGSGGSALSSRGRGNVKVKEDSSSKESTVLDDGDGNDNAIAGDDEYDLDHFEELDGRRGNYTARYRGHEDANVAKKEGPEKKKVAKKRGRKPFKCRSLKSLL